MHHHHHHKNALCALLMAAAGLFAGCSRAEPPPPAQPYALPTLAGPVDMTPPPGELELPRPPDADALFAAVVACYPAPSWFRGELAAVARVGSRRTVDFSDGTLSGGSHYVGMVARIPLFSPVEADRERERESHRRVAIAQAVGTLNDALMRRAVARRKAALYRSLESRAALRVKHGVGDTAEQAGYLEKLAGAEEAAAKAEADIVAARLTLRGMCQSDRAGEIDRLIDAMAAR